MAINAIRLAGCSSKMLYLAQQQTQQVSKTNCFKAFFLNPQNKLARFITLSKASDKVIKCTRAIAECTSGILQETQCHGEALIVANKISKTLKIAREVVALPNVFSGALPSCVLATKSCYQHAREVYATNPKFTPDYFPTKYNQFRLQRGDYALLAAKDACFALSSLTYSLTFGVLRPTMFVNNLTVEPFLPPEVKANFITAVVGLMTINHATVILGNVMGLVLEMSAYKRAIASINSPVPVEMFQFDSGKQQTGYCALLMPELQCDAIRSLRREHVAIMKKSILSIVEKGLELICDGLKLIPMPLTSGCNLAITGCLIAASSAVGTYSIWTSLEVKPK
ncbi:hypothetical protein [Candidatus Chlamydia sanziniae]|uniref:Uncharacterized protein n=1 Tax=Candidatus Chlamydia sanziniae TaxID=1806891 RepID=A0A1A9HTX7_9CHLA|nr:hypothetical protein [Candidatus Chlamydia sanziniae]ANH78450.1 hypothetical protein Cs308_0279 [Candidatus Chlamydia sanziniae]